MARLYAVIALVFILTIPLMANARQTGITSNLIIEKNEKMQDLLKQRDPRQTMAFLHSHISHDATFNITVQNSSMPAEIQSNNLEMDKTDYINSFIKGLHYVDNYNINIETKNINIAENGQTAIAEEITIEEGVMLNPHNLLDSGIPFLSKTTCQTVYTLNDGIIQSDKASCHTETGEISTI